MSVYMSYFAGAGWQFFTNDGIPLTGGKLYTYAAGTTTPATTYTSSSGLVANTNPIVLDAAGRVPNEIWLTANTTYKFVLKTSDDVLLGTYDNISAVSDPTAIYAALSASSGSTLVGYTLGAANAVPRTVQSRLRDFISVKDFGAVGNNIVDDGPSIQKAIDSLPANGGAVYFPAGTYKTNQMLTIAQRNVRLIGENAYNTYISAHGSMDATIQVTGFAFELANMTIYSPDGSGGYCIWSTGSGDMYIHDNNLYNGGASGTGYGIYLDDHDPNGVFVAGAYRHKIIRNVISLYSNPFSCGISTAFGISGGGMNACVFEQNYIMSDLAFSIASGGGNVFIDNLCQSATGGNSGSRPYTGGVGSGLAFGGESHAVGNYFERYAQDFIPTSSSARCTIVSHTSDASNNIYNNNGGYANPAFAATGYGVSGEQLDLYPFGGAISANNLQIDSSYRAVNIHGNGAGYYGIGIKTSSGTQPGQLFSVWNNSWPLSFSGATLDLSMWGSVLVLGQQGTSVSGIPTVGNFATFMYTETGVWKLISVATHSPRTGAYEEISVTGAGQTVPTSAAVVNVAGNGSVWTGTLLASGKSYGQTLILTGNSWSVTFASGAAIWSTAGAPTIGNVSGNCLSVQLVYTASGWTEVSRAVRP